jgi:nicotinamidase-related amidase
MLTLDASRTAVVAIDMHRGHLNPAVATLPLPADRCPIVIGKAKELFDQLRPMGLPIIHAIVTYRDSDELLSNPFWKAIHDDPEKKRSGVSKHNLVGSPGTEIIPDLYDPDYDIVVNTKKRYSPFLHTDLQFILDEKLGVDTVVLCGINTSSCVLCAGFESTNLDYRVVVAEEACDTMDGREAHDYIINLMRNIIGWPMTNEQLVGSFTAQAAAE